MPPGSRRLVTCRDATMEAPWVAAAWDSVCTQQTGLPLCLQRVGRSVTESAFG